MFRQLTQIALGRLRLGPQFGKSADVIVSAEAVESLTAKSVQLDIVATRQPNEEQNIFFPGTPLPGRDGDFLSRDCGPLKSAEVRSPAPPNSAGVRGSWNANLVAAVLGTPCLGPTRPLVVSTTTDQGSNVAGGPDVTVVVSADVAPGKLFEVIYSEDTRSSGIYTDYHLDCRYDTDECKFQVPVAGRTTSSPGKLRASDRSCVVLPYAYPVSRLIVEWTAERLGAKPAMPRPRHANPKVELLKHSVTPAAMEVVADGATPVYRVSGRYEYALHESVEAGVDVLDVALLPIYDDPGDSRSLAPEDFVDGILGGDSGDALRGV